MHAAHSMALSLGLTSLFGLGLACSDRGSGTIAQGEPPAQTAPDSKTAAEQSLAVFRRLVNENNYRELGFENPDEANRATLGEPLPVMFVRLDRLQAYRPGDPESLLTDLHQMSYPVLVDQSPRSSVVVQEENGRWKTATLGNGALARQIAQAREAITDAAAAPSIIHVGALGLYFLGQRVDNQLMLAPLTSHPEIDLRAGAFAPADAVFQRLVPLAKSARQDAPM